MIETMSTGVVSRVLGAEQRVEVPDRLDQSTYALVLVAGRGSRLEQLTDWRAKPALPFAGTPKIVDFTLGNCINSGIRHIGVLPQYKAQSLIRHMTRGWGFLDASQGGT